MTVFPAASGSTDVPGTEEMVSVMVTRGGDGGGAPATSHQVSSQHCDTGAGAGAAPSVGAESLFQAGAGASSGPRSLNIQA